MSEYKARYTVNEKRKKLAKFNSVYYEGDPDDWKVSRLPNWMNFYGYSLDKELRGKLPKYYRKFTPGTVVMIDYGVPIGNELGGYHFGVVISNNDTKYKRKVTVIPLSSHYHRGYVDLGYDLMDGIIGLIQKRMSELEENIGKVVEQSNNFMKTNSKGHFEFSDEEMKFLKDNNISTNLISNADVSLNIENKDEIKPYKELIDQIKSIPTWGENKGIFNYVSYIDTVVDFQDSMLKQIEELKANLSSLNELQAKFEKYNKQSYAVISDIKSVSKLRVTKLNHYTISGNTRISDGALNKIRDELIKTIV